MSGQSAPIAQTAVAEAPVARRRNAADSRERLLSAAHELFSERGYEGTTVREVGQRAEVDPAMIARYFGGKAGLYLASIRREPPSADPLDLTAADAIQRLLDRVATGGPTPTIYAAVRPHEDDELQAAAVDVLERRIIRPAHARAASSGHGDAQLRAEIVTAALAGILLSRTSGAFSTLADAPSAEVGRLVAELAERLLNPEQSVQPSYGLAIVAPEQYHF
ncbi:TetR/AcrR family transcriptional regulator [Jatrophihabitans sp. DSM 45814]